MAHENGWTFLDDRGRPATAPRTPERPVAYVQAGAALYDLGIRSVGVFGSAHDGAAADPVKAGALPLDGTAYLGPGPAVDAETVLAAGPDLVVAVAYGAGGPVYGLDPDTAKRIEERLPVVVLDVGQERSLDETRARFAELARSLGAPPPPAHSDAARAALTAAAAAATGTRVLALSPAGPDSVHLARPRRLAGPAGADGLRGDRGRARAGPGDQLVDHRLEPGRAAGTGRRAPRRAGQRGAARAARAHGGLARDRGPGPDRALEPRTPVQRPRP